MQPTSSAAIEVSGLEKVYSGLFGAKRFQSLSGVSLEVPRGEVFGLLGPNGAGKTTMIKILLGIIRSTGGRALVLGERAGSKQARRHIGYLPENLTFPSHQTAQRALQYYGGLSRLDGSVIRKRGAELIEMVGLKGRDRESVARFSKGMRQRLGLAQAMLHDPQLLILDEPTDGLDPVGRSQIRQLITLFKQQGKTVFLNSHILQEVELVCDRVAILVKGQLKGVGTPRELAETFRGAMADRVVMEVAATSEQLRKLAYTLSCESLLLPNSHASLKIPVQSQADVDRAVDLVRAAEIGIVRLERERPSLEQVFLSLVGDQSEIRNHA
ncbi:MAG: ABC transporter ATP-binding protein [Pirellulales bacterium]